MTGSPWLAKYLEAVLSGSRRQAASIVTGARAAGLGIPQLYLEVFQPALREVGRLWEQNRITVADEHLATAITQALMAQLYGELLDGAAAGQRTLVAACVDTERHEVGLRMVCDLLEIAGWDAVYLGSSVPVPSLIDMVADRAPDAVALSVSMTPHLPRLRYTIEAMRQRLGSGMPVVVAGGRPFVEEPALAARVGADIVAMDAAEAVQRLQERFGS